MLPEKWFIKTNSAIEKTLIKWRDGGYAKSTPEDEVVLLSDRYWIEVVLLSDRYWIHAIQIPKDYKEISFDHFKKYVLKQKYQKKQDLKQLVKLLKKI